jgi:hypothetical protein
MHALDVVGAFLPVVLGVFLVFPVSEKEDQIQDHVSNSGGIKLSTCQSLGLKNRGYVEDRCGGVPHVARFVQQRVEHQRDRQKDWTQPCDGAKASEFSDSPVVQKEID